MMAIDKGRTGILKDTIISPRDLNLNQCPKPGLPYQWQSPTSPDTSYTPWAADPPGILPSLRCCCEHGQPRLCMAGALGFPSGFSLRAGRPRPGQRDTHSSTASLPSHFMATTRKTWSAFCSCFTVTDFLLRGFCLVFLIATYVAILNL